MGGVLNNIATFEGSGFLGVDWKRMTLRTPFLFRNQRCERPIFTRSHFRCFLHTSPFQGFDGKTTSYFSFQSALSETFALYASMEVVVGNCEQKIWGSSEVSETNAERFQSSCSVSLLHSRQPKDLREMSGLI